MVQQLAHRDEWHGGSPEVGNGGIGRAQRGRNRAVTAAILASGPGRAELRRSQDVRCRSAAVARSARAAPTLPAQRGAPACGHRTRHPPWPASTSTAVTSLDHRRRRCSTGDRRWPAHADAAPGRQPPRARRHAAAQLVGGAVAGARRHAAPAAATRPGLLRQVVQPLRARRPARKTCPGRATSRPASSCRADVRAWRSTRSRELLNNAIDHSGGSPVTVSMRQTPRHLQLLVSDDGCGLFERIGASFGIADPTLAMLELSKGKLTQPARAPQRPRPVLHLAPGRRVRPARQPQRLPAPRLGRRALAGRHARCPQQRHLGLRRASRWTRRARSTRCCARHSLDGAGYALRAHRGAAAAADRRRSRAWSRAPRPGASPRGCRSSAAPRSTSPASPTIGHGFADELFRVFARAHPAVDLVPLNMAPRVRALVDSVRRGEA